MAVDKYITKKTRRQAAVILNGNGQTTISIQELATSEQTLDVANLKLTISDIYYQTAAAANIVRGSNVILNLVAGYDTVKFSEDFGFVLDRNANANVVVNLGSGENTLILQFSKGEGYNEPDRQALKPYER